MKKLSTYLAATALLLTAGSTLSKADEVMRQNATPGEYQAVVDTLVRFGRGIDTDNGDLIASAFAENGVADFSAAATKFGFQFPPIEGRDTIRAGLGQFAAMLVTSHAVSGARVNVHGNEAKLQAIVQAQHIPAKDPSRHHLQMNDYDITLVRDGENWLITKMTVRNIWSDGEVGVVMGK